MAKISRSIIAISLGLMANLVMADDGGSVPGYVYTPTSGSTVVKSAYGQCVHNAYWEPAYGLEECGEAPEAPPAPEPTPVPKIVVETITMSDADTVLFNFDKPTLTLAAQQKLTVFANKFKESGDVTKITVDGYTDTIGTDAYNKKLSADRAATIKNFFVANGFSPDIIVAKGMGEQDAKASVGCIAQFGDGHLAEIDRLTTKLKKTRSAKAKKQLKSELAKLTAARDKLITCAAPDRKVVLLVEHTQQVKKQVMVMPSSAETGKVTPETTIKDSSAPTAE